MFGIHVKQIASYDANHDAVLADGGLALDEAKLGQRHGFGKRP
jgi:hypothetical protein